MMLPSWRQIVPTTCTLAAMLSGFLSIVMTVHGMQHPESFRYYSLAAQLIMLAMILDGLDGNLARWLKGTSEFGAELDTYVDMTAFGIAPAILIFAVTKEHPQMWIKVLLPSAVCLSGVVRLARFKVADPLRGQGGYAGLPITANAAWVALFVFISLTPPRDQFSLQEGWFAAMFLLGIVVFITLQVTTFRYPKPTKKAVLFIPCIVLVFLMWALRGNIYGARIAVTMLLLGVVYVVVGPFFVKQYEAIKARQAELNRRGNE